MSDSDKNQHLSPILSDIQDYGPGEQPAADAAPDAVADDEAWDESGEAAGGVTVELSAAAIPGADAEDLADQPAASQQAVEIPELQPAPAARRSWPLYLLATLLLLGLVAGGGGYYLQQGENQVLQKQVRALERELEKLRAVVAQAAAVDPLLQEELDQLRLANSELQAEVAMAAERSTEIAIALTAAQAAADTARTEADTARAEAAAAAELVATAPVQRQEIAAPTAASTGGPWFVNLRSYAQEADAREWAAQLADSPRTPEILPIVSNGNAMYRVRLAGFASQDDAQQWADSLQQRWSLSGPWVSRN